MTRTTKVLIIALFATLFTSFARSAVYAQAQDFEFSGSDPASYQCIDAATGEISTTETVFYNALSGRMECSPSGNQAILKPPKFQQIEIWFLRILYVIWAVVASLSFFYLVVLGYRYMLTRGDVTKITEIRLKIIYYAIGLALVFLAVPILVTIFNLLAINDDVECYNVQMPGFQFFFSNLCTDPMGVSTNPCDVGNAIRASSGETLACSGSEAGTIKTCTVAIPRSSTYEFTFTCTSSGQWVFSRRVVTP